MTAVPVYDFPEEAKLFVAHGLWDGRRQPPRCAALGFATETEGFVAGVLYHNHDPDAGAIELTAYSSRRDWLTRENLRAVFAYPFDELDCRLCVARISERNKRALRIWRAFGATLHPLPDLRAEGEAEVVALLRRDVWRNSKFMRNCNGKA